MMYYKRLLTLCGVVQLCCGLTSLVLFLLEWKVFGLLIPVYAVGIVHIFCGAWCLLEIYRRASITAALYTSGACISAASMAVSITLIAVSSVDLKDVNAYAQYYASTDNLISNVDKVQVLIGFGFTYLIVGLISIGAAFTQFLVCMIRLLKSQDNVPQLPTRVLENRLSIDRHRPSIDRGGEQWGMKYVKMKETDELPNGETGEAETCA